MTTVCPSCGAHAVEDMEGNAQYMPHMHDCPYRRTFGEQRRSMRERGAELIADARWQLRQVNWEMVAFVIAVTLIAVFLIFVGLSWVEESSRGR